MNNDRKRVLLPIPRWKKDDYRWPFWYLLRDVLQNDFSRRHIELLTLKGRPTRPEKFDLIFTHHARNNNDRVIDYKTNYLPHLWYLDTNGFSGYSDISDRGAEYFIPTQTLTNYNKMQEVEAFYENIIKPQLVYTKFKQEEIIEDHLPEKFLFIATQIESDTVMKLKETSTKEMVRRVVCVSKQTGIPIVIKTHPRERDLNPIEIEIKKYSGIYENIFFRSYGGIRALLERSVATFVINSGVGFETLMRLKPVFSFGKSDYMAATWYNKTEEEITEYLKQGIDQSKIMLFLYNYWKEIIDMTLSDHRTKVYDIISKRIYDTK